jgi:hypothetical protein
MMLDAAVRSEHNGGPFPFPFPYQFPFPTGSLSLPVRRGAAVVVFGFDEGCSSCTYLISENMLAYKLTL